MTFQILQSNIGSKTNIPGWPSNDIQGLFDALCKWTLDPRAIESKDDPDHPHAEFDAPGRCLAWVDCIQEPIERSNGKLRRYVGTRPMFPEHPKAVSFVGNFLSYSFGFNVVTDDKDLIEHLDALIKQNMASQAYIEAREGIKIKR